MQFDYFYGTESKQFSFYKIPKALMKEECFKKLSNDAKLLYALMLDRISLSRKNGWLDEENRVYIIYKLENIIDDLNCSRDKGMKIMAELDTEKGVGLIERKRRGQGKPTLIYMKKIMDCDDKEEVSASDSNQSPKKEPETIQGESVVCSEVGKSNFKESEIPTSRSRENQPQEVEENDLYINNTNINKNNINNTNLIYPINHTKKEKEDRIDRIDTIDRTSEYIELIKLNIEYDWYMKHGDIYGQGYTKLYEELFQVICDVVCVERQSLKIGGEVYPYELVKSKFLKLKQSHLDYVIECMQKITTKIGNIKAYMITALYNAPNTMNHYYQQEVQWDRYACG